MKYGYTIYLMMLSAIIGLVIGIAIPYIYDSGITAPPPVIPSQDNHLIDFGYMQHYVKFHIYPEHEGQYVTGWASDTLPVPRGYTDNKSEVVLPMIPAKYYMYFGEGCYYTIYPSESSYNIWCKHV